MNVRSRSAARPATLTKVPFDYEAAEAGNSWRDQLVWPVAYDRIWQTSVNLLDAYLTAIRGFDDPDMLDVALLAYSYVSPSAAALAAAALAVQGEAECGIELRANIPEIGYLRGQIDRDARPEPRAATAFYPPAEPKWLLPRRLARTKSWTPWHRLPFTLIAPEATAISHNPLLRESIAANGARIDFDHAETLFAKALRNLESITPLPVWGDVVERLVPALTRACGVDGPVGDRFVQLMTDQTRWVCHRAARDLAAVRAVRRIPKRIYAGSAGYWPVRVLSIEVLRRDGHVTRFDHGGGRGLIDVTAVSAIGEYSVSSEYVVATEAIASCVRETGELGMIPNVGIATVKGGGGDPHISAVPSLSSRRRAGRGTLLYAPLPLLGFRQAMPPFLPDIVNLDWQMRLIGLLRKLPMDLICCPHPEGIFKGRTHPLGAVTELDRRRYESLIPETDVFIFDYTQTTTFYTAVCTDRPVVLLDMGMPVLTPRGRAMVERRCRIVPITFDDRNLPRVDAELLDEAVRGGSDRADPTEWRRHFLGETP